MSAPPAGDPHPSRDLLPAYLNGSLDPAGSREVAFHLATCGDCAAELDQLAEVAFAIERYGTGEGLEADVPVRPAATPVSRSGFGRALGLAAALLVSCSAALYWTHLRFAHPRAPQSQVGGAIQLDLGAGPLRGAGGGPLLSLPPEARTVALTFFPPALPGARFSAAIVDAAGRPILPEAPLGSLDHLGRGRLDLPAAVLRDGGSYRLVLHAVTAGGPTLTSGFPFRVARADDGH